MKNFAESSTPDCRLPAVRRRFDALLDAGAVVRPAGKAKQDPQRLLERYRPRCVVPLFDVEYFLSGYLFDEALGFFVGYLVQRGPDGGPVRQIFPRIFYKDSSLMWRAATHFIHDEHEYWIGKGDVRPFRIGKEEYLCSVEETTNLPYEVQAAFDACTRVGSKRRDDDAIALVVRQAPSGRLEPYADFLAPRRQSRVRINRGKPVAWFECVGDPTSLHFADGYEPDFDQGVVGESVSGSTFFGGNLRKFRVLSSNRQIQYLFFASPTHAWLNPPQALTHELSTYGVRLVDVAADDDLFVPGYEYHEVGEDGTVLHSQIPAGFVGAPHPDDSHRADASRWLEALPVIQEFRRRVLRRR